MIVVVKGRVSIEVDDVKFSEVGKEILCGQENQRGRWKNSHVKITSISNNESKFILQEEKLIENSPFYVNQKRFGTIRK